MKAYSVSLNKEYSFLQGGELECLLMDCPLDNDDGSWKRPAVIVVPGGAYWRVSKREGEPVAAEFIAKGFHAFVLTYLTVQQNVRYPEQLLEVASAVDYVRKHAKEMRVNPDEIFVVGFSAGGHLTGNLAVEHQNVSQKAGVALDCKPTAVGLSYPVISPKYGHCDSHKYLLKGYTEEEQAALMPWLCLDEGVNEQTPPAFIWSTAEDKTVPPENALRYALALSKQGINFELHVYPRAWHGISTASKELNPTDHPDFTRISHWVKDCIEYFKLYITERI